MAYSIIEVEEMAKAAAKNSAVGEVQRLLHSRLGLSFSHGLSIAATEPGSFFEPVLDSDGNPIDYWVAGDVMGSKPA